MLLLLSIYLLLPLLFSPTLSLSRLPNSTSYTASIVSLVDIVPVETYLSILASLPKPNKADIIVFPEQALDQHPATEHAEVVPAIGTNLCSQVPVSPAPIQRAMSCKTREIGTYIAFDISELGAKCEKGSPYCYGDHYIYNTELIYDRMGTLIAKYQKHHPTGPPFKPGPKEQKNYFDTDFGVRFGMFICYDIVFRYPSVALVENLKLTDFVFSTQWVDIVPGYALSIQQGWTEYYLGNILAANVFTRSKGSGIFSRGTPLVTTVEPKIQILTASVPKLKWIKPPTIPVLKQEEWKEENQTETFLATPGFQKEFSLKVSTMECHVSVQVDSTNQGKADYFVVEAVRQSPHTIKGIFCGVMNCGESLENCGVNRVATTRFKDLKVDMRITGDDIRMTFPLLTTSGENVFDPATQFSITHNGVVQSIESTEKLDEPVLIAGMFGRLNDES